MMETPRKPDVPPKTTPNNVPDPSKERGPGRSIESPTDLPDPNNEPGRVTTMRSVL